MTSSRLPYGRVLHSARPRPPPLPPHTEHHPPPPCPCSCNPRCCYTDAKWKSPTGLVSEHVAFSPPPPLGRARLSERRPPSRAPRTVLHPEKAFLDPCVSRRELRELPARAPPHLSLGPWLCPRLSSASPAQDAAHAREAACTAGSAWPQTGIQKPNVCCGHFLPLSLCLSLIPNAPCLVVYLEFGTLDTVSVLQVFAPGLCAFRWQRPSTEMNSY